MHMRGGVLCITGDCGRKMALGLCITLCMMWIDMRIYNRSCAYTRQCIYILEGFW